MTEQPDKIKGKCTCGNCHWRHGGGFWECWPASGVCGTACKDFCIEEGYCATCGYHLAPNGFARRTVVVPEDPIYNVLPAPLTDPPIPPLETAGCRYVRYLLIPASGEGSHDYED